MSALGQRLQRITIFATVFAALLLGPTVFMAPGQEGGPDPAAALVASDPAGQKWLAAKEASEADSLSARERLRLLAPWAERYLVALPAPLHTLRRRPEAPLDAITAGHALAGLREAIDDAVRRSIAAKEWKPMGELAPWEAFLARHGFRLAADRPSPYILGVRHRTYRRAPKLPQAIHTCLLTTREDRPAAVFGVNLRYTYPPEVALKIEELERGGGDYEKSLALRLPAFQADRTLLSALGRQALGESWPSHEGRWGEFIEHLTDTASVSSRARVLAKKDPPTISEVRLLGDLVAHLYEIGPTGRLELQPQGNALDLRGNPLYGARRTER